MSLYIGGASTLSRSVSHPVESVLELFSCLSLCVGAQATLALPDTSASFRTFKMFARESKRIRKVENFGFSSVSPYKFH